MVMKGGTQWAHVPDTGRSGLVCCVCMCCQDKEPEKPYQRDAFNDRNCSTYTQSHNLVSFYDLSNSGYLNHRSPLPPINHQSFSMLHDKARWWIVFGCPNIRRGGGWRGLALCVSLLETSTVISKLEAVIKRLLVRDIYIRVRFHNSIVSGQCTSTVFHRQYVQPFSLDMVPSV